MRIIARLDIKNNNLIKGINLEGLRVVGSPNKFDLKKIRTEAINANLNVRKFNQ